MLIAILQCPISRHYQSCVYPTYTHSRGKWIIPAMLLATVQSPAFEYDQSCICFSGWRRDPRESRVLRITISYFNPTLGCGVFCIIGSCCGALVMWCCGAVVLWFCVSVMLIWCVVVLLWCCDAVEQWSQVLQTSVCSFNFFFFFLF